MAVATLERMEARKPKGLSMNARPAKQVDTTTYSGRLAVRIHELRIKSGMTVDQLADAIRAQGFEVKKITVYSWERGASSPHVDAFPYIARALGLKSVRALLPEA